MHEHFGMQEISPCMEWWGKVHATYTRLTFLSIQQTPNKHPVVVSAISLYPHCAAVGAVSVFYV